MSVVDILSKVETLLHFVNILATQARSIKKHIEDGFAFEDEEDESTPSQQGAEVGEDIEEIQENCETRPLKKRKGDC